MEQLPLLQVWPAIEFKTGTMGLIIAGRCVGIGLLLAGMANPAKVLGFLDITGVWAPSLARVMIGAIAVAWAPLSRQR